MHQYGANQMNQPQTVDYLQVLEALTTAVLVVDADKRVSFMNPAAETLLATSIQRGVGREVGELVPLGITLQAALMAAEQGDTTTLREETLVRLGDANPLCVDCTVSPFGVQHQSGSMIIELDRVDQLTRIARDTWVHERQDALNQIVRALAHEIKNPLGGLRGAAQLLDRELPRRELREYTYIITHEADRLSRLVDRLTGGFQAMDRQPFNLHSVLEHVRKLILVESPEGVEFKRDYDPSIPDVCGDRAQMIQVVLNIVRNAVQAMERRGQISLRTRVRRQYTLRNQRHRLVVEASITDNGPGIDPELIDRVFFPMVTGRAEGTGLGLALAQEIIHRHAGSIECTSEPGRTCFVLALPVGEAQ